MDNRKIRKMNNHCHIDGGKMASVMLSACCAHPGANDLQVLPSNSLPSNNSGVKPMDGVETTTDDSPNKNGKRNSSGGEGGSDSRRGSNLWSEKMRRGENNNHSVRISSPANDTPHVGNGARGNKPFASNPLIGRGDSLVANEPSLLSLVASETMETHPALPKKSTSNCSDTKESQDSKCRNGRLSSKTESSLSIVTMPPEDSAAMELSMAKQAANTTQMSNARVHNREVLRNYRSDLPPSPSKRACGTADVDFARERSLVDENDSLATSGRSLDGGVGYKGAISGDGTEGNEIMRVESHSYFENAQPPPLYLSTDGVNSELVSTYQFPRLYLRDPSEIIEQGEITGNNSKGLWWFLLAQRMETTLKHVQDDHWRILALGGQQQSSHDSISAASSVHQQMAPFGFFGLESASSGDGCTAVRDLCLGKQHQHSSQQSLTTSKSLRRNMSSSSFGSKKKQKRGGPASTSPAAFQPSASPINVWSEPSASTVKVRGATYSKDGIKIESEDSIFSMLGVDSFVTVGSGPSGVSCNENDADASFSWGTKSFLERWTSVCEEMELESPPFLLIFNFIVPWGNFKHI